MAVKDKAREGIKVGGAGQASRTSSGIFKQADRGDHEAINTANETTNRGILIRNDGSINSLARENRTDLSAAELHELEVEGSIDGTSPEAEEDITFILKERAEWLEDTLDYLAEPIYQAPPSAWHPPVAVRDEKTDEILYYDDGLTCSAPPGWNSEPVASPENPVEVRDPTTNEVSYIDNGTQCLANESVDRSQTPVTVLDSEGNVAYVDNGTECLNPDAVAAKKAEASAIKTDPVTGLMADGLPDYASLTMTDDIIASAVASASTEKTKSSGSTDPAANDAAYDMDAPPQQSATTAPAAASSDPLTAPVIQSSVPVKADFSTAAAANDSAYDFDPPTPETTSSPASQLATDPKLATSAAAPSFG